jgi:uncharacterized protein YcbK (DUF882 family)
MSENWSEIKYFKKDEFVCKCGCGKNNISFELVKKLDMARLVAGVPFRISSACRCEAHNTEVGGVGGSSHIDGLAVDIVAEDSQTRFAVLSSLLRVGFVRVGVANSFIHCDIDAKKPQNLCWVYQ